MPFITEVQETQYLGDLNSHENVDLLRLKQFSFISQELWQNLQAFTSNKSAAPSLMVASYPSKSDFSQWRDETVERDFKVCSFSKSLARFITAYRR